MATEYHGVLEVDTDRGVIYFHDSDPDAPSVTVLRICGLKGLRLPEATEMIDITHMVGYSVA